MPFLHKYQLIFFFSPNKSEPFKQNNFSSWKHQTLQFKFTALAWWASGGTVKYRTGSEKTPTEGANLSQLDRNVILFYAKIEIAQYQVLMKAVLAKRHRKISQIAFFSHVSLLLNVIIPEWIKSMILVCR